MSNRRRPRAASHSSGYYENAPMNSTPDWRSHGSRAPPSASRYSRGPEMAPDMSSRREYQRPSHFETYREPDGPYYPHQSDPRYSTPQDYYEMRVSPEDEQAKEAERRRFDPARSRNAFVNGAMIYRFAMGDPLCVRCGSTGHLPNECRGEALSWVEQDYLYTMVRREQNRSKVERGFDQYEPSASIERMPMRSSDRPPMWEEPVRHLPPEMDSRSRARLEDWRRDVRPPSEAPLPMPIRSGKYSPVMSDAWDGAALESQEEQFEKFQAGRKHKPPLRMPPPSQRPPPSMPAHDDYSFSNESKATELAYAEKATKPKKKKNKKKAKRDDRNEVELSLAGAEKVNAEMLPPQVVDSQAQKVQSTLLPSPVVGTAANAAPAQLRLIPLGTRFSMGASVRLSNGEAQAVGPHPSTIRVSARYLTQAAIEKYLSPTSLDAQERSQAEAREDSLRLQGVAWIDNVRRALQLPVRTYTSACVFYHKFRLAHPFHEYSFSDAAAASLLNACKAEDTLKKSRDILAAAYNLKQPVGHEHVSADDPIFEGPSRTIIGLERLVLESSSFDFTNRAPHDMLVKVAKSLSRSDEKKAVCQLAWTALTDIHRTFAPLKQTSATLSLACLELAAHFKAATSPNNTCAVRDHLQELDLSRWHTTREEVMEILLDALDMYTHHTTQTILGTQYSLDAFLRIRLALNKECTDSNIPRHTIVQPPSSPDNGTGTTLRVSNGHPTPVSPPQAGTQAPPQPSGVISALPVPEGGGTLRFMLNPQRATDERAEVSKYYTEEYEEYEEEIEVPIQRDRSKERDRDRDRRRDHRDDRYEEGRRSVRDDRGPPIPPGPLRDRERAEPLRDRERDAERERTRMRERDRDRRYDDRRYDDRERDRRYDDRRERGDRDRDRRYYDEDRRRREDRR